MIFRDGRLRVVGIGGRLREGSTSPGALRRVVGLISTVGGERAAANSADSMVHTSMVTAVGVAV